MPNVEEQTEERAAIIERATDSQQPRLKGQTGWGGPMLMPSYLVDREPPAYSADSRTRDSWLRQAWRLEPHLAGVMNAVVLIDSNRGWTMTGGRNQVRRYTDMLHNAENGAGWRMFARKASLAFWSTDMGTLVEVARDGRGGPLRALYNLDSARCKLTGDPKLPLQYWPAAGGEQRWGPEDYFRLCSLPSDDEAYHALGYCAVSRCIELTRLLYAVMVHDQELVAARAPKGLLLLSGISEEQWNESLTAREEKLDTLARRYYAGVQILASSGMDAMDAKLVALSQLPANFDAKQFTDLSMYGYALAFGYDPSEFWPVQFGAIGRGTETEVQHQKATGKGGLDFALALQEQLQAELPPTLAFEFESRDDAGELTATSVQKAKLDLVATAYQAGLLQGAPLVSREEARQLLAEAQLIPEEWTLAEEDVTATDTEDAESSAEVAQGEEAALESERVQRAIAANPHEAIVRYAWPTDTMRTLWDPERRRKVYAVKRREVLYEKGDVTITDEDVLRAIRNGKERVGEEFFEMLTAPTIEE